jgi:uncharacterized protein YdeI (YjbR/CyaY-like superfamily)
MEVVHFPSAAAFRAWLAAHHASATELWVGFFRKDTGRGGLTYPEALDEALCFGWIDGIRKKVDAGSYTNRFTPRRARSTWSRVNICRVGQLKRTGRMTPAGSRAFAAREAKRSGIYSFEQERQSARLNPAEQRQLRANARAWRFFQAQPPGYRRTASWWVVSAKREETRGKRLQILVACCARGQRVPPLAPATKR